MLNLLQSELKLSKIHEIIDEIDQVDQVTSSLHRQMVQEILATPELDLILRIEVADLINQKNRFLAGENIDYNDSY